VSRHGLPPPEGSLTDTGPLFALADPKGQPEQYTRCAAALAGLPLPLVTTWPCLAEALHLTRRAGGWPMQQIVNELVITDTVRLHAPSPAETLRTLELMAQYQDRPMDLADASLIALAETRGDTRIFSVDSDFYVYRLADGRALEVAPGPYRR
jgi:predicted nucleic acid-binding protein